MCTAYGRSSSSFAVSCKWFTQLRHPRGQMDQQGQIINCSLFFFFFFGMWMTNKDKGTRTHARALCAALFRRHAPTRMMSLRLPSQGVHSLISYYSCPRSTVNPLSMRRLLSLHHVRDAKLPNCPRSQFSKVHSRPYLRFL